MLQVKCFKCGWPIILNDDFLRTAVEEADANHATHYNVTCPKCRRVNKVSVKQMKRALPPEG